jgi:protein-tyrosine phosphatase
MARNVVMRQIPHHLLWLGHAGDGRDYRQMFDAGIQALVQLAAEEPVVQLPRDLLYCRFPLVDGPANDRNVLQLAIATVANLLEKKVPTLVVCGAGLSRSPAIAAAALAMVLRQSTDDCLKEVTEHFPADVAPALWLEVKDVVEIGWQ